MNNEEEIYLITDKNKLSKVLKFYENRKNIISRYQKTHPEIYKENSAKYYEKIKQDPEKYKNFIEKQKNYNKEKFKTIKADPIKYEEYLRKNRERYRNRNIKKALNIISKLDFEEITENEFKELNENL